MEKGEVVSDAEYRDGELVVTITTRNAPSRTEAGKRFLEISREIGKTPTNPDFLESDDPRIRVILDR